MIPIAHCLKTAKHQECSVQIIDTPTAKPASIRLLFLQDELNCLFDPRITARISVCRQHFQDAARDVHGRWVKHRVMVGKRNVLEDRLGVVFVERRPAAVLALHRKHPSDCPLLHLVLVPLSRCINRL